VEAFLVQAAPTSPTSAPIPEELLSLLQVDLNAVEFDWESTDNRIMGLAPATKTEAQGMEVLEEVPDHPPAREELPPPLEPAAGIDTFDLSNVFADEDEESWQTLFSAFKKGVDEQIDEADTESHYNLGIAYKEMGLYEDAVAEFRHAARDPRRAADCACLEGVCWRDKGDLTAAETAFRTGLEYPALSAEALFNVKYELGLLFEMTGRGAEALQLYREIARLAPEFRDVDQRIGRLSGDTEELLEPELLELEEESTP
jgi:tetratricopeptide (TPR) repeat protein